MYQQVCRKSKKKEKIHVLFVWRKKTILRTFVLLITVQNESIPAYSYIYPIFYASWTLSYVTCIPLFYLRQHLVQNLLNFADTSSRMAGAN